MARKPNRTEEEEVILAQMKRDMAKRLLEAKPKEVYDAVILQLVKADCRWIIHAAVGLDLFYGGENRGKSRAM